MDSERARNTKQMKVVEVISGLEETAGWEREWGRMSERPNVEILTNSILLTVLGILNICIGEVLALSGRGSLKGSWSQLSNG